MSAFARLERLSLLGAERDAQCLRKTADAQLGHHVRAVDLDGPGADSEIVSDGLVWQPLRQTIENVAFAGCEGLKPYFGVLPAIAGYFLVLEPPKSLVQRGQQRRLLEWLFNEVHGASLHCPHGERYIAVAGHDDDRKRNAFVAQRLLNFEAVEARHADVQQNTSGTEVSVL